MVFVIGKHRMDISRPLRFCGRHKFATLVLAMVIVLSMSASVCALQSGAFDSRPAVTSARSTGSVSGPSGAGHCPPPYVPINYSQRYDYSSFRACDWFMFWGFTGALNIVAAIDAELQTNAAEVIEAWLNYYADTHQGYCRFPAYKRLWSRSEIGQPI